MSAADFTVPTFEASEAIYISKESDSGSNPSDPDKQCRFRLMKNTLQKETLYIVILNNRRLAPKRTVMDLLLDISIKIEVKKKDTNTRVFTFIGRVYLMIGGIVIFIALAILYIKSKNMSKEVKIYDKVLEELEIQLNK